MRSVPAVLCAILLVASLSVGVHAQDIPEEYEDIILDLVERYEEARELLRIEMERNEGLVTRDQLSDAIEQAERPLLVQIEALQNELEALEAAYKAVETEAKNARDEAQSFKDALAKSGLESTEQIEVLSQTLNLVEEESLFQVGATFAPSGALGALGIVNLPGSNMSIVGGSIYRLREQSLETMFGVTFSFLRQQTIIEGWNGIQSRLGRGRRDESAAAEDSPVAVEQASAAASEQAPVTPAEEEPATSR